MIEKKLEIMEKASAVFMRLGIKSVTLDDLARELGISKKTFYKYFEDKNDLVRAIITAKTELDKSICIMSIQSSSNAIESLYNITSNVIQNFSNINPSVFYDLRKYHPDAWEIMHNHKDHFVKEMIINNVKRGITEGYYRQELDPEIMARLYITSTNSLLDGTSFPWPDFKFEEVFLEIVKFQLFGMTSEKGRKYLIEQLNNEANA